MELEEGYEREKQSGSGTATGYTVEVRTVCGEPKIVGNRVIHKEWRQLHFENGPVGVPQPKYHKPELDHAGLLGYQAAEALRWWFHAELAKEIMGGLCIETRLVKHKVEYQYKSEAISQHKPIGGEDRSSDLPDWGVDDNPK